jgi:microcystin-dependent protein
MTSPYVGEIRMFGFPRIPANWLPCDGRLLQISQYEVLYTLLGTTFGGDGVNTFGVPDLRGRIPLHQGTGPGLSPRIPGQISGAETITLTGPQMPAHTHPVYATTNNVSTSTPGSTVVPGALTTADTMYATDVSTAFSITMANNAVANQGGGQPHDNTMPTLPVSYCIATAGIFPSQG